MPSANGFYWYIKDPLYVSIQDDSGKQPRTKIAYKMRYKDKSDIPYIEVPAGGYKNIIFRLEDVLERIKGDNRDQVLQSDLDKGWFQCKIWNNDGREISKGNLVLEADEIPLVQSLLPPQSTLDDYAKQWIQSFRDAVEVAAEALSIEELGGWDVLSRFFCPSKGVTFRLGLFPSEGFDITQQDIDTVKKAYKGHMGVEPIILCFHSETELERNGWFKFSSNPLGMYTTWVHGDDKDRLEGAQTEGGKWERKAPTFAQTRSFNKRLLEGKGPDNSPHRVINTQLPIWRGENLRMHKRWRTERFMGESANKWAKWGLGWSDKDDETIVAEWLHRIAHRFDSPFGHRNSDMIFSTKECNTSMMRAEAAMIQLTNSNQFYQMLIQTRSKCAYELWDSGYPRWVTKKLKFRIVFQTYDPDRSMFEGRSEFSPFSRRHPFRFEYELDRVLLKKCLKALDAPEKPGPYPNPDLLAQYEGDDPCGSAGESTTGSSSASCSSSSSSFSSSSSSHSSSCSCSSSGHRHYPHPHPRPVSSSSSSSGLRHVNPKDALTAEWEGNGWMTPAPSIIDGEPSSHHHDHRRF